jgi:KaiC/GvpD/RAD55 family RecA-like ATPase
MDKIANLIPPESFIDHNRRIVWEEMQALHKKMPVDITGLSINVENREDFIKVQATDSAGAFLANLDNCINLLNKKTIVENIHWHVEQLNGTAQDRETWKLIEKFQKDPPHDYPGGLNCFLSEYLRKIEWKYPKDIIKRQRNLFAVKTVNSWIVEAAMMPIPKALFKEIWAEGELSIFFGDSGIGKTLFAVQLASELAKDYVVGYVDFELTAKQWEKRYSDNYTNHYCFPENFIRCEIDPAKSDFEEQGFSSFEELVITSIENTVLTHSIKILFIDNITYLSDETEKAKRALRLMKKLTELKKKYNLSILVLAHTPKRDQSKPITKNDLAGSKNLYNFVDSCFAIGESSKDSRLRYLKQIKPRSTELIYGKDNVLLYEVIKQDNFLAFIPVHAVYPVHEHEHLKERTKQEHEDLVMVVKQLKKEGNSYREIHLKTGVATGSIKKYLDEHIEHDERSEQDEHYEQDNEQE